MGKFVVKPTSNNGFMFNLFAPNGQIIATSQTYTTLSAAKVGIDSIKANCSVHIEDQTARDFATLPCPKYEVFKDNAGQFRFRLRASNGQIVVASQGYTTKVNCLNGIESIGKNAPGAETVRED